MWLVKNLKMAWWIMTRDNTVREGDRVVIHNPTPSTPKEMKGHEGVLTIPRSFGGWVTTDDGTEVCLAHWEFKKVWPDPDWEEWDQSENAAASDGGDESE